MRRFELMSIAGILIALFVFTGCGGGLVADTAKITDYDSLIAYGWIAYNKGNYAEARSLFTKARLAEPAKFEGYLGDGWALLRSQYPDSAIVIFKVGFSYTMTLEDSVDAICGLAGSYLAIQSNSKVVSILTDYPVSHIEKGFPFQKHDLLIDSGDLDITQAMALYRLGKYSSTQQADPDNALYHLNKVLDSPYVYTTPEELISKLSEYFTLSEGASTQ
jgi:hypothetical protein